MSNVTKNFDTLATSLSVLHNYFDSSTKFPRFIIATYDTYDYLHS